MKKEREMEATLTEQEIEERLSRWSKYVQPTLVVRRPDVPGLLEDEPPFKRLAAERDALLEAEHRIQVQLEQLQQRNDLAQAEYNAAVREATLTGGEFPEPLVLETWKGPKWTGPIFDRAHMAIEAMERGLLAERADEWRAILEEKRAPLSEKEMAARRAHMEAEAALRPFQSAIEVLDRLRGNATPEKTDFEKRVEKPNLVGAQRAASRYQDEVNQMLAEVNGARRPRDRRLDGRR